MSDLCKLNELRQLCQSTNLWTNHESQWVLQIDRFAARQTFGPSFDLPALIAEAIEWRPKIRVKKVDAPPSEERYSVTKGGSNWQVLFDGQFVLNVKTKKAGEEFVHRMVDGHHAAYDRWKTIVLPYTVGKVEGVDYEFETVPWQEFAIVDRAKAALNV